jgi:hypothetical protein
MQIQGHGVSQRKNLFNVFNPRLKTRVIRVPCIYHIFRVKNEIATNGEALTEGNSRTSFQTGIGRRPWQWLTPQLSKLKGEKSKYGKYLVLRKLLN